MTLGDRLMVLNAGRVEQFDTPIALYERPASMFVAGFIGSPAMNFLPATIENGALTLENKTVLPGPTVAAGAVIIGIRPEHLVQRPDGPLAVRIEMLEHLGANTLVHGVLEGTKTPIVVSIDGLQTLPTNAILCFAPKEGQIHMFDRYERSRYFIAFAPGSGRDKNSWPSGGAGGAAGKHDDRVSPYSGHRSQGGGA